MALNPETTSTLSDHLSLYYERRFLDRLMSKFHFDKFGMKKALPKGEGKSIKWNRWDNVAESTTALTEGTSPNGINLSSNTLSATVAGYGQFATASDFLIMTAINDTLSDYVDLLAYAAGKSLDALVRNEVDANSTFQYADSKADEAAVEADSTAVMTAAEIRKAVKTLRNSDVDPWEDELYRAIIHPFAEFDLLSESTAGSAIQTVQYTSNQKVEKGMIGSLYGVLFFRSSHIRAVAPNTHVYRNCVIGKNAYGLVDLESAQTKIITKQLGSAGTEDALDQRATVGYKFYFASKVLDANRTIVIPAYGA